MADPAFIFWDNDGVLVDTEHLYLEATREVLARRAGVALSDDDYRALFLVEARGAWHLAAARGATPAEIEALKAERDALYAERLATGPPPELPGARAVLAALHDRVPMACVTSSKRAHFALTHARTGFERYFRFVVAFEDVVRCKPDPEPYRQALARAGAPDPAACLAVEDSTRGLRAALAAGLPCCVVPSRLTRGTVFPGAARVLASLAELLPALHARG